MERKAQFLRERFPDRVLVSLQNCLTVNQHHKLSGADKPESLRGIVRLLGHSEPKHINRSAKVNYFEASPGSNGGAPAISAYDQIGAHLKTPIRRGCPYSHNSFLFDKQVRHLRFHA
jgi:hypothetical protein